MTYQKKSHASEASHELNPWTCMDLDELFGSSRRYAVDSISLLLSLSSPPLLSLSDISLTSPSKSHFERQQLYHPFMDRWLWMRCSVTRSFTAGARAPSELYRCL